MRRLLPLISAVSLIVLLSALTAGCGGDSKPGLVTSWGQDGVVRLPGFEVRQTTEDRSGRIVAVGLYKGRVAEVARLLPDGSLDPSFGKDGIVRWPFHMFQGRYPRGGDYLGWDEVALLRNGRIVLAGTNIVGHVDEESTLIVSEIDQSGRVIKSFGDNGYFLADKRLYDCSASLTAKACKRQFFYLARTKTTCTRGPESLAVQGEKIVVSAARFCNGSEPHHIVVLRLNANGLLDKSFGKNGEVAFGTAPLTDHAPLLALPKRLVVAGTTPKGGKVRLTGLLPNGALDPGFGRRGVVFTRVVGGTLGGVTALMSDGRGVLSVTGNNFTGENDGGPFLVRFTSSGQPLDFRSGSRRSSTIHGKGNCENFGKALGVRYAVFAQLENRELAIASGSLARITPEGAIDPSYPPQQLYGGGKLTDGLLAASDGTVLVTLRKYHVKPGTYTTYLARYR